MRHMCLFGKINGPTKMYCRINTISWKSCIKLKVLAVLNCPVVCVCLVKKTGPNFPIQRSLHCSLDPAIRVLSEECTEQARTSKGNQGQPRAGMGTGQAIKLANSLKGGASQTKIPLIWFSWTGCNAASRSLLKYFSRHLNFSWILNSSGSQPMQPMG